MKNLITFAIGILTITLLTSCVSTSMTKNDALKNNSRKDTAMKTDAIKKPIVIAHRGASGYAPEHSLVAKAMAHTMGVDYIEQDVVMTKDDYLVVLHDPYLDRVTNVMEVFPERSREIMGQTRWLAIDFTLAEIKSLKMTEGFSFNSKNQTMTSPYPSRFPLFKSSFQVSTLEEEIELIQGLNHSTGKDIGIYVEVKAPWLHKMEGKDISLKTLQVLKQFGYQSKTDKAYFQCFDPVETERVHNELFPQLKMDIKLVQLIAHTDWNETMELKDGELSAYDYNWLFSSQGMKKVASYADGIGPWMPMLVSEQSTSEEVTQSALLQAARDNDLQIHPYTFREEANRIPKFAKDFEHLLEIFIKQLKVDGIFSDHPDKVIEYINRHQIKPLTQRETTMKISGKFEVKLAPMDTHAQGQDGVNLARMSIDKTFMGELDAVSKGEMLSAMTSTKGSAGYVAIEQVTGTLSGKKGSFVLQHFGTMQGESNRLTLEVVPDSGSGELSGLAGTMEINIEDGKHFYVFEYALD